MRKLALLAAVLAALPAALALQSTAHAQQQLPGVVVQGTTLDPQPLKPPPKAQVTDTADEQLSPQRTRSSTSRAPGSTTTAAEAGQPQSPQAAFAAVTASDGGAQAEIVGLAAERSGSAVSVVTRAELEQRQIRTAGEALRSLPGVSVSRSGGVGALTQVRLRGNEGNHTLVLVDGVEANDATNGEFDFSDLAAADIERIEVIRGPQSGLYGSGAAGGVINIVTRAGRGPAQATASYEGGSFRTQNVAASISGGSERVWGAVSAGRNLTQGFNVAPQGSERDGYNLTTVSGRLGIAIADGLVLNLSGRHSLNRGDYDEFGCDFDPITFGCRNGVLGTAYDARNTFEHSLLLLGANLQWDMLGGALTHVIKASHNDTDRTDRSAQFGFSENRSKRSRVSYAATGRLTTDTELGTIRHFATGLIERQGETFQPRSDFGFGFAADGVTRLRTQTAYAGEYRGEFADRLFVQATVRRDDSDQFGTYDTWRTSASLKLPGTVAGLTLRPHASYGTAFKLPTLFEQFGSVPGFFTPNPALKAERIAGWDGGLELAHRATGTSLDITYFSIDLTDKIGSQFLSNGTSTSINLTGTSTREGVEIAGRWAVNSALTLGAAYTFTDARDPSGLTEVRRPPHTARGDVNWLFSQGRGSLTVAVVYNGRNADLAFRNDTFESQRVQLDGYWLGTVAASYRLRPGLEVFARVENAFDQRYQEVYGYNTAGVAGYAGLKVSLGEGGLKVEAKGE